VVFQWSSLPLLMPALILIGLLFLLPIGYAFYYAFTNLQLAGPHAVLYGLTGLQNVKQLIHDPEFLHSIVLTVIFIAGSAILGQTVIGLALALIMRRALAAIRLSVGAIVVLAWVLPSVTSAFVWYAFAQQGGTLGTILHNPAGSYLVNDAMLIVSIANSWRSVAFSMLMFAAALRNLPTEVLEAAEVDGIPAWRRLSSVVIPMLRGTIVTNLLLVTLGNISEFTLIWILTRGGPVDATTTMPVYMYLVSFIYDNLGYGSMIGLALVLLAGLISLLYVRNVKDRMA